MEYPTWLGDTDFNKWEELILIYIWDGHLFIDSPAWLRGLLGYNGKNEQTNKIFVMTL